MPHVLNLVRAQHVLRFPDFLFPSPDWLNCSCGDKPRLTLRLGSGNVVGSSFVLFDVSIVISQGSFTVGIEVTHKTQTSHGWSLTFSRAKGLVEPQLMWDTAINLQLEFHGQTSQKEMYQARAQLLFFPLFSDVPVVAFLNAAIFKEFQLTELLWKRNIPLKGLVFFS